jgi:hypothetical protein
LSTPGIDGSAALPGGDLIERGVEDLARGLNTAEAALVEVAHTRLSALGVQVPDIEESDTAAELRLYARLASRHPERDPYPLYSAWLEQLDSLLWALTALRC